MRRSPWWRRAAARGVRRPAFAPPVMLHLCRLRVCNSHGHLRRRHRDHRQRLLGPRDGDPPQAGGDRGLHRARAWGRRGRHLALQHVPGLRLRRALAPLLLLLRPQPRLERDLLAPARDPRLPAARRRRVRHPLARAPELRRQRHRVGRGTAAGRSRPPTGRCARASSSPAWARWRSPRRRRSRASTPSRARRSTPRAGTTTTTSRASASPSSAPAPRRSSSCPRSRRTSSSCT